MTKIKFVAIILLFKSVSIFSQNFKKEIDSIYNFSPQKLSDSEQKKIFPRLDTLFEKVKSDTSKYLPLLRQELRANNHEPYFYFDCGHLLMILSKSMDDQNLAMDAFVKSDIKDLSPRVYISILCQLSNKKVNVTKAAVKMLEDSTFSFFIVEHAMVFSQAYCLTYCLLPLEPNLYTDTLISIFKKTKFKSVQNSIITTLWFSYSCVGDDFLKSLNKSNTLSNDVAKYAAHLLKDKRIHGEYQVMLPLIKAENLKGIQEAALSRYSDEAIIDLDFETKARRRKLPCR